jgi:hypothetical protein
MKFLLDQDVYAATARFLASLGHDSYKSPKSGCHKPPTKNCSR